MEYTYDHVKRLLDQEPMIDGEQHLELALQRDDQAWNPASTKHMFHGYAYNRVRYVRYRDGGFDVSLP